MDLEATILATIALAFAMHVQSHPISVPDDWLDAASRPALLCTGVDAGLPCLEIPASPAGD
jgi:hypothetical protein